ncbi:MAG: deacetylase [Bryobacteraceae bacterium]|jgi:hypothetical protein
MKPACLITIDTEGDNLWAAPAEVTTENARWLPRFQALCERYGFRPTYVTTHEMARCPVFVAFGRDLLRRNAGEIGAHLHAWNSPPLRPITANDSLYGPYATEYPVDLLREKVSCLTRLLEDTFEVKMTSHRAGRWGFDGGYARALIEHGYVVDCSVTPGISWKGSLGRPDGDGGPDYTACPGEPYFVDLEDIRRPGCSGLLEVPVTIMPTSPRIVDGIREMLPPRALARRVLNRLFPPLTWLRPGRGTGAAAMLRVLERAQVEGRTCVEFMLHSSELMPGGSPVFPDADSIENLYRILNTVFAAAADAFSPSTLTEFATAFSPSLCRQRLSDRLQ